MPDDALVFCMSSAGYLPKGVMIAASPGRVSGIGWVKKWALPGEEQGIKIVVIACLTAN